MSESDMLPSALAERDALLSQVCGQSWPYGALLDALQLLPACSVPDVGAGEGALLTELRRRDHRCKVLGVDLQPGAGVQRGSAESLPFPDATFDVVILLRVLAHLPDPDAALDEARRVLKPGGQMVRAANGADHLRTFWTTLGQVPASGEAVTADLRLPVHFSAAQAT